MHKVQLQYLVAKTAWEETEEHASQLLEVNGYIPDELDQKTDELYALYYMAEEKLVNWGIEKAIKVGLNKEEAQILKNDWRKLLPNQKERFIDLMLKVD